MLVEGQERVLAVLPPFHIYALSVNMLLGIRAAAELILHTRFDAEAVLKEIATNKVTSFPGVPTMFTALLGHPDVAKYDLLVAEVLRLGRRAAAARGGAALRRRDRLQR